MYPTTLAQDNQKLLNKIQMPINERNCLTIVHSEKTILTYVMNLCTKVIQILSQEDISIKGIHLQLQNEDINF